MYTRDDILTKERLEFLRDVRKETRDAVFKNLATAIGKEAADEARSIYELFDEKMIVWLSGLWDPDVGGFYFSNSARDTEGFLPDLESTAQALEFIGFEFCEGDEIPAVRRVPERFISKACDFAIGLQDPDGFFYHPQWGKNITTTRRGRDLGWAKRLVLASGREYKYPSPYERDDVAERQKALPEQLRSIEAYKKWLGEKDLSTHSYSLGNYFNSTTAQVIAAGPEFVKATVDWFNEKQNPENGLWEPQVNYESVSGLMKIVITLPCFGAKLNYPEKAFDSALQALTSDEPVMFSCQYYNAWCAMRNIICSQESGGNREIAERLRKKLLDNAAQLIRITGRNILLAQGGDGAFAYWTSTSGRFSPTSQGAPVSPDGIRESDINGNGCSTRAPLRHMFAALGVEKPRMFTKQDAELLFELMDARTPVKKIR